MKNKELEKLEEYKAHLLEGLKEAKSEKLKEALEEELKTVADEIIAQKKIEISERKRLQILYSNLEEIVNYVGEIQKSDEWATGHGINKALNQILGNRVHIIHPDQSSIYSPASSNKENALEGAINYAKIIGGFFSGEDLIANGLIHQDGGSLKKPIIMIINTTTIEVSSSTDPLTEGGSHWHSCVILPKNYVTPLGMKLNNGQEIIFYLDSLNSKAMFPQELKHLLTQGIKYTFKAEEEKHTHQIFPVFPTAKIVDGIKCNQQLKSFDCGWWAVYNALMVVFTGNISFIDQFKDASREPAYALRKILPKLEEKQIIAVEPKEKEKELERISTEELIEIQHAIYSSFKSSNLHKKRKREIDEEKPIEENKNIEKGYTIQKKSRQPHEVLHRRLDSLARLLQLNSECSAVCFDGEKILIASNEFFIGSKDSGFKKQLNNIMHYFSEVANGRIDLKVRNKIFKEICREYIKQEAKALPSKGFTKAIETLATHALSLTNPMELRNYSINQLIEIGGAKDKDFITGAILGGASIVISRLTTDFKKIEQELISYKSQDTEKVISSDIIEAFKNSQQYMIMRSNGSKPLVTGQPKFSYLSVKTTEIEGELETVIIDKNEDTEFGYALLHFSNGYDSKMRGDKKNLHAELQILQALIDNSIKGEIYIGVSKLCCPECSCAILAVKEVWGKKTAEEKGLEVTETLISEEKGKGIDIINYGQLVALFRDHHAIFTEENWTTPYFLSKKDEKSQQAKKRFKELLAQLKRDIKATSKEEHHSMYPPDSSSSAPSDIEGKAEIISFVHEEDLKKVYDSLELQTIIADESKLTQTSKEEFNKVKSILEANIEDKKLYKKVRRIYNLAQEVSYNELELIFRNLLLFLCENSSDSKNENLVNFFIEKTKRVR